MTSDSDMIPKLEDVALLLLPDTQKAREAVDTQKKGDFGYLKSDGWGSFRVPTTHVTSTPHRGPQLALILRYSMERYSFGHTRIHDFSLPSPGASGTYFQIRLHAQRQRCYIHFYNHDVSYQGLRYYQGSMAEVLDGATIKVYGYEYTCKITRESDELGSSSARGSLARISKASASQRHRSMAGPSTLSAEWPQQVYSADPLEKEPSFLHYRRGRQLGAGGQGQVWLYQRPNTGDLYAVKTIKWRKEQTKHCDDESFDNVWVQREAIQSTDFSHPNIISILDVFFYPEGVAIIMPYYENGDLGSSMENEPFDVDDIVNIMMQLASGLKCLKSRGAMHRDIKPENIMIRSRESGEPSKVVLADLGLVRFATTAKTHFHSYQWTAPELRCGQGRNYGPAVDIWSLGYLLFRLLGCDYQDTEYWNEDLYNAHLGSMIKEEIEGATEIGDDARTKLLELVQGMLAYSPDDRPTLEQVSRSLEVEGEDEGKEKGSDGELKVGMDVEMTDMPETLPPAEVSATAQHEAPGQSMAQFPSAVPSRRKPAPRPKRASAAVKAPARIMKRQANKARKSYSPTKLQCLTYKGGRPVARDVAE